MYVYTVIVVKLEICSSLEELMRGVFEEKCVKLIVFFFVFARTGVIALNNVH